MIAVDEVALITPALILVAQARQLRRPYTEKNVSRSQSGQCLVRFGYYDDVVRCDLSVATQEGVIFSMSTLKRKRASDNRRGSARARDVQRQDAVNGMDREFLINFEDVMSQLASFRGDVDANTHLNSRDPFAVKLTKLASSSSIGRTNPAEAALCGCIDIGSRSNRNALGGCASSTSWHGLDFLLWLRSGILSRRIRRDQGMVDQRTRTEVM